MKLIKLGLLIVWAVCFFIGILFLTMFMPWLLVFAIPIAFLSLGGIHDRYEEPMD